VHLELIDFSPSVRQESIRAPNYLLLRRACYLYAALPSRRRSRNCGNAYPVDRAACPCSQTGIALRAPTGTKGGSARKSMSQFLEVFHGGEEIFLRQRGFSTPRQAACHAAQGVASPGASRLRRKPSETSRLRRPAGPPRLADPAKA